MDQKLPSTQVALGHSVTVAAPGWHFCCIRARILMGAPCDSAVPSGMNPVIPSGSPHLPRARKRSSLPSSEPRRLQTLVESFPRFLPLRGPLPLSSSGSSLKLSRVLDLAEGRELQGQTPRVSVLPCCFLAVSPGSRSTPASVPLFLCKTVALLPLFEDRKARAPNL